MGSAEGRTDRGLRWVEIRHDAPEQILDAFLLIAVGAILAFAIDVDDSHGFNLNTVGIILGVVGAVSAVAEIIVAVSRRRTDVVQTNTPTGSRTTYSEPSQY